MLLAFPDEMAFAARLARAGGRELGCIEAHCFPDGEWRLRLPAALPADTVLLRSLHHPSERLVQLLLAADTARELGAQRLSLIAPYLCYMRQDKRFRPGEVLSQQLVGRFLAARFDRVISIDPHLHRVATLAEAVPAAEAISLSAAPLIGQFLAERTPGAILIGPDEESAQWVGSAAAAAGLDFIVCHKQRHGDRDVHVSLPAAQLTGRSCVLVDDMVSTGHTIAQTARALHVAGCTSVDVAVCHALPAQGALALMREAGIGRFWSTDTVPDPSNAISIVALLAPLL